MMRLLKLSIRRMGKLIRQPHVRLAFGLTLFVVLLSTGFLSINLVGTTRHYGVGDVVTEDIRVTRDIQYRIASETERKKEQVSQIAPLVFDRDHEPLRERMAIVDDFFRHVVETMKEYPPMGSDDRSFQLIALKARLSDYKSYQDRVLLGVLKSDQPEKIRLAVNRVLVYVFELGVLEKPYDNPLGLPNRSVVVRTINSPNEIGEVTRSLDELMTLDQTKQSIYEKTAAIVRDLPAEQRHAVQDLVRMNLRPNMSFNQEETRRRIEESVRSVKPVMGVLKKGQTIAREGDTVTTESLEKINILNVNALSRNVRYIAGILLIQVMFLLIFGYLVLFSFGRIIPERKSSIMIFSIIILFIVYTFFISRIENISNSKIIFALLLPIPFVTMMIAILNNIYIAMMVGLYVIFFSFAVSGESSPTLIMSFSSAFMGAFMARDIEKRSGFLRSGVIIGFINAMIVVAFGLMGEFAAGDMAANIQLAIANGVISAILVLGFFPMYEAVFGVTTNFKLLELSDLNASIFRKLLIKAPGTYNHSLMVANMSEAACKEIGANHLLARVGGYYHDIGKLPDSGMYIENKITDPRAKVVSPLEYSKLIISHVEKGVEKAKKDGLPEAVIDFIREHHGKSVMTYFYHQALEAVQSAEESERINKAEFQYPGPSPHSRETAIVMLADAVEAASRSLHEPTYEKIEGMVKKIVYNKLNDGELERSDLTMSELNSVQKAFLRILYGIFHTRIEYPSKSDIEDLENRIKSFDDED